jgi:hypothetical protein
MARQSLESWISESLTDEERSKCTALSLVHYVGQVEREVWTTRFGGKAWTAKALADIMRKKAEAYSQDLPGVQTFCILAFYEGKEGPQARMPMSIQGEPEFNGLMTEGPHSQGLMQQMMRHNEAVIQLGFRQSVAMADSSASLITQLSGMLQKALVENHDAIEVIKTVILERATSEHEFKMKELKEKRDAEERRQFLKFLPALTNTIFGREVFPVATADTALVETIAEKIDEKQLAALAAALPPELLGILANRFASVLKEKRLAEEDSEHALSNKNPEDDAAGD